MVNAVDEVDTVDAVNVVEEVEPVEELEPVEVLEPEIASSVIAPIAQWAAILHMYAGSGKAFRREESAEPMTTIFGPGVGSRARSKSIAVTGIFRPNNQYNIYQTK